MATFWGQNVQGAFLTTTTMTYWQKEVSYTQYQRINNIHHALYHLQQPLGKILPTLWQLFRDKRLRYIVNHNNNDLLTKGGAISYTHCQRMNNIHHALYYLQPQRKMLHTLGRLFGDKTFKVHFEPHNNDILTKGRALVTHTARGWTKHITTCTTYNHWGDVVYSMATFQGQNVQGTIWTTSTMT